MLQHIELVFLDAEYTMLCSPKPNM